MSADLIKEKISQAVEKINSLKEELRVQKAENENLQSRITEMHASNLELNNRVQLLEEEKRNLSENNESTVKDIEDRLAMLTELLEDDAPAAEVEAQPAQNGEQEHFF